jgi:hypothetical protein
VSDTKRLLFYFIHVLLRSNPVVQSVNFLSPIAGHFALVDLERLKKDSEWLSDSHVTFALK